MNPTQADEANKPSRSIKGVSLLSLRSLEAMQRFLKKTKPTKNGCVEWQSSLNQSGYGTFGLGGKVLLAHRLSWAWANNKDIPVGMQICHACDNPACIQPEHLWVGTAKQNAEDARDKGRMPLYKGHPFSKGQNNSNAKLTAVQVADIRSRCADGEPRKDLAVFYGVNYFTICDIVNGRNWK